MLLEELVRTSSAVADTTSRGAKIDLLAELLGRLPAPETQAGVRFLAGEPRQHRLGLGPAAVHSVKALPGPRRS